MNVCLYGFMCVRTFAHTRRAPVHKQSRSPTQDATERRISPHHWPPRKPMAITHSVFFIGYESLRLYLKIYQ